MTQEIKWTPVGEALPVYMHSCLVWCPKNNNIFCAYYHFHAGSNDPYRVPIWEFFDNTSHVRKVREPVTHWTTLPEPPTPTP